MPAYEDPALALRPGVTVLALSYASEGEARRNIVVVGDCGVGWFGTLQEDGTIDCVPCPDATYRCVRGRWRARAQTAAAARVWNLSICPYPLQFLFCPSSPPSPHSPS